VREVLLDSNLLVVLLVGLTDRQQVGCHKKTSAYSPEDYDLLVAHLKEFDRILVTPHVLAECSNLLRAVSEPLRTRLTVALGDFIGTEWLRENHVEARAPVKCAEFPRLGLTDAALLDIVSEARPLLTADLDLYLAALKRGGDCAVNFNHLREF
jgi:hypothetical protein